MTKISLTLTLCSVSSSSSFAPFAAQLLETKNIYPKNKYTPNKYTKNHARNYSLIYRIGNFLTRSTRFCKLVDWVFGVCDINKTGQIGKSELYSGLLLVHINLAKYAGPAACFVSTKIYLKLTN